MPHAIDSAEKLRLALLRILNLNNLKLFGCIIYNFIIELIPGEPIVERMKEILLKDNISQADSDAIIAETTKSMTAFATFQNGKPFIGLYSTFVDEKSVDELIFVILHEVLHILDGHHYRGGSRDAFVYNLAGDHVINTALKKDIDNKELTKVKAPKDMFIVPSLTSKDMTTQDVYDYLQKKMQQKSKRSFNIPGLGTPGDGSGGSTIDVTEINVDGQSKTVVKDVIQSSQDTTTKEQLAEATEALKAEVRTILNSPELSGRGFVGGALKQLIDKIIEVEIPWEKLLERVLLTKIVPAPDNRVWTSPLKRLRAHGIILPGAGTAKKASVGCILIDTSGSISDKDLRKFTSVVLQSLAFFDELWIMKHDVPIHQNKRLKSSEATMDDFIYKYKGRGGTSHADVFKELEKAVIERKEQIGIVIMLTDFESNVESLWGNHQWVKKVPVSVVLTRNTKVPPHIDPHPILIKTAK